MRNKKILEQTLTIDGTEYYLRREKATDSTWWAMRILENGELDQRLGEHLFTLDLKKIYSLFPDYPKSLTAEEKELFDRENPYWAKFFSGRSKK